MENQKKKDSLLTDLKNMIIKMNVDGTKEVTKKILKAGIKPFEIINECSKAMQIVGKMYEKGEYFIPELLVASDAMLVGIEIVKPYLKEEKSEVYGKIVLGTVQGDIHEIGKKIVGLMLTVAGFEVYDLGVDVPPNNFIEKANENAADIIGSSAFMTTTIQYQQEIEKELQNKKLKNKFYTMIGGPATSQTYAKQIGADAWALNAVDAVERVKLLLKNRRR